MGMERGLGCYRADLTPAPLLPQPQSMPPPPPPPPAAAQVLQASPMDADETMEEKDWATRSPRSSAPPSAATRARAACRCSAPTPLASSSPPPTADPAVRNGICYPSLLLEFGSALLLAFCLTRD